MINNHVVSAQWAQALKDAGYPQDSTQFKLLPETEEYGQGIVWESLAMKRDRPMLAAPLATELLEQLPVGYTVVTRFNDDWLASWAPRADEPDDACYALADDAANALAELWIILKEQERNSNNE